MLAADVPDRDDGERFELPVDDRLRAAARGDARRPPRRPGHRPAAEGDPGPHPGRGDPEQVAPASGTRVERIMRFAHPVLQERARVAEQARDARVRLSEGTPSVPLEQFMSERLRLLGADLDAVRWDAHRTEDGTWHVRAAWRAGDKSGTTRWSYDIPARTVTPFDATTLDFAEGTRLVRVVPDVPAGLPAAPIPGARRRAAPTRSPMPRTWRRRTGPAWTTRSATSSRPTATRSTCCSPATTAPRHRPPAARAVRRQPPPGQPLRRRGPDTQDTVVLGRLADGEVEDPRARIPAWEDIVFGVRRHR